MAIKAGLKETIAFIPSSEKDDPKPTTIFFKPLSKQEMDKYQNSLAEFKRNKFVSHAGEAFERLCNLSLSPSAEGNYILNINWKENGSSEFKFLESVKDKQLAVKILVGLQDNDIANELEIAMKDQSSLNEDEEKN